MRDAAGGPQGVVRGQGPVDQGTDRRRVADGRDTAEVAWPGATPATAASVAPGAAAGAYLIAYTDEQTVRLLRLACAD